MGYGTIPGLDFATSSRLKMAADHSREGLISLTLTKHRILRLSYGAGPGGTEMVCCL